MSGQANAPTRDDSGFDTKCDQVASGHELPQVSDLIRGCPFMGNDIYMDANAFAETMMGRLATLDDSGHAIQFALAELMFAPIMNDFLEAASAFEAAVTSPAGKDTSADVSAVRCYFYAAVSGHMPSASKVAAFAVTLAYSKELASDDARSQSRAAVAWLLTMTGRMRLPGTWTRQTARAFVASIDTSPGPGRQMVDRMLQSRIDMFAADKLLGETQIGCHSPDGKSVGQVNETAASPCGAKSDGTMTQRDDDCAGLVVVTRIGNDQTADGRRVVSEFMPIIGRTLPVAPVPDLAYVRRQLISEFPHASGVIDAVIQALPGTPDLRLPPIILVGPSGGGKTTFAVRLVELFKLPFEIFPCGGVSDGSPGGNSRRWSTGETSLPLNVVLTHRHGGPAIILDELEKATSTINGSVFDVLLGLMEPRTAQSWRDPYIEAPVDLSRIAWICTANSLDGIPLSLKDRCLIIRFPQPEKAHLSTIAHNILVRSALERGLDPRWAAPLDGHESAALANSWGGGSIRRLTQLVGVLATVRERFNVWH